MNHNDQKRVLDDDCRPVALEEGLGLRLRWPDRTETLARVTPCAVEASRFGVEVWVHGVPVWCSIEFLTRRGVVARAMKGGAS